MRILIDATVMQLPMTGVARAALGLYQGCLKIEPSLQVNALCQRSPSCAVPAGMRVTTCGAHLPEALWRSALIPGMVLTTRPTVVHFPWNGHVPRLPGVGVVATTIHDVLPLSIPEYFRSIRDEKRYRRRVQRDIWRTQLLMTDSEYSKGEILRHFDVQAEPVVIHPAATLGQDGHPGDAVPRLNGGYFLYVGGYDSRKGLVPLLRVLMDLHQEWRLEAKLVLTGSKNYFSDEFRRLVDDGRRRGIVEERGYVPDAVLRDLYVNATALIYPSKYEGFGYPPLEAMSLGCPVITTRCTSIPEICGDAAYYVEPDDQCSFATALIDVDNRPELRQDLAARGRRQAARFSGEESARKYLRALEQVVRSRHALRWVDP